MPAGQPLQVNERPLLEMHAPALQTQAQVTGPEPHGLAWHSVRRAPPSVVTQI
jgi:hypothetical protein